MKIISWNCNGKFRDKQQVLLKCDADIFIIQECENPIKYKDTFNSYNGNYIWFGLNDNKGLCVFAKDGIILKDNCWKNYGLRHFLSVNVNQKFDLLCVWASPPYIEEYFVYQQIYKDKFSDNMIIMGDFNSNSIWDKKHRERNHSEVVRQLNEMGLVSAYHFISNEAQGKETKGTFFLHRDIEKSYHIDYCFVKAEKIKEFYIMPQEEWLGFSDHVPIVLELNTEE